MTGEPLLRLRRGTVREIEVPRFHTPEPELSVARPRGYLVPPGWPQVEARLSGHGLRVERLTAALEANVETIRVADPVFATTSYQGAVLVEDFTVSRTIERRIIPAGRLWIPAGQPDFEVAVQLLEPEAPDSLLRWGLVNTVFERKTYIDPGVLEELAQTMLADAEIEAQWMRALDNRAFAADPQARYLWWYRRTPSWDDQVGLMPVLRAMAPLELTLEPWPAD